MPRPHFPTKSIYARSIHQTFPALKTRKRKGRRSAALENNQIQISTPGWADGITHLGFQLFKPNPAKIHNPNPNPHPISLFSHTLRRRHCPASAWFGFRPDPPLSDRVHSGFESSVNANVVQAVALRFRFRFW